MVMEAVFFDLDDTLVLTHAADKSAHRAVTRLLAAHLPHIDHQAVLDSFLVHFVSEPWDPHHQIDVTEWRSQLWNRGLLCQNVDDMDLARDLQSCFDSERLLAFRWADGVEALVMGLQSHDVKVGIITNGHSKVQRAKLKACKAENLFTVIVVGGEELNEKPHKEIFLKACKMAGCEPEKAIMVGDNLKTDIQKQLSEKQMRWANLLSQFHFQIVYVQGQKNVVADALSRKPLVQAISAIHHSTFEDMIDQYATDPEFIDIFTRIRDGETVAG
ncbi:hypothetical protein L7F22_056813 [Adiantum nelumboides]|nr:hypothetical protein [Adiantum nelumboides]